MKKIYTLLLLLSITFSINAQIVNIPDANFKNALLNYQTTIDTNGDGEIQVSEAENITSLSFNSSDITDLTGIEAFVNIRDLVCSGTDLISLDLKSNINLVRLEISRNKKLVALNIYENTKLKYLTCFAVGLTELDLTNKPELITLDCRNTFIKSLDLSKNNNLTRLQCKDNSFLTSLNISNGNNINLTSLDLRSTPLICVQVDNVEFAENNINWIKKATTSYSTDCSTFQAPVVNIPDANFKNALLNHNPKIDLNEDGEIQLAEAEFTKQINASEKEINSLIGIEYFTEITSLGLFKNNLTSIDLSKNNKLERLNLSRNKLSSLDVSKNISIRDLSCDDNQIENLNLSNLVELHELDAAKNLLTNINLTNNVKLSRLYIDQNSIENLNLVSNTELTRLNISSNPLKNINLQSNILLEILTLISTEITEIDITKNINLTNIDLSANKLKDLNLTANKKLEILTTNNIELKNIDLSQNPNLIIFRSRFSSLESLNIANANNTNIVDFDTSGTSTLSCVTVDNVPYSQTNWTKIDDNTNFSEDCSSVNKLNIISNNGTITTNPDYTNGLFTKNTSVILTAMPNAGYQFDGWSGDATGNTNPLTITMNADKTITAIFSKIQHTLTTNATNGTITRNPVTPTSGTYDFGTDVELTATPNAGYQFDGWSSDASGKKNPLTITMDADKTVTALFSKKFNLDIEVFATGFISLEGIGINSNNEVFVSEYNSGKIFKIDTNGNSTEFASSDFRLNDISFNKNNQLFVSQGFIDDILISDTAGNLSEYVDAFNKKPNGLTFYDNALYYTSDLGDVYKVDSNKSVTVFC